MLPPGLEQWLAWVGIKARAHVLGSGLRHHAQVLAVLAFAFLMAIYLKKDWRQRYGSRNFRVDLVYYFFYYSGLYHFLVLYWLYRGIGHLIGVNAPWLQLGLAADWPPLLQVLAMYLLADFVHYWGHRWRHSNRFLWAFHSVHHSQTRLTVMSNYRSHIVDETLLHVLQIVAFQIVFGMQVTLWLGVSFLLSWLLLLEHSEFDWNYGVFGRLFVSPVFHRVHHAIDRERHDRNFGGTFSFWDDLFGTSIRTGPVQCDTGLAGNPIGESLRDQLMYPFRELVRLLRQPDTPRNPDRVGRGDEKAQPVADPDA